LHNGIYREKRRQRRFSFCLIINFFSLREKVTKRGKKRAVLSLVTSNKSLKERGSPRGDF
jgi:hypothetical protein